MKGNKGRPLPFAGVLGGVLLFGMALALASSGVGVIATVISLFYDANCWAGAAFALTFVSVAFVDRRCLFTPAPTPFGWFYFLMTGV